MAASLNAPDEENRTLSPPIRPPSTTLPVLMVAAVVPSKTLLAAVMPDTFKLAGVMLAARITSGQPNAAQGFELNVISACVLGGVSLLGGRATISGVLVGVLIMGTVQNAMNLLNIDAFYQYLVRGAILLAAVLVDQLKNRGGRE